MWAADNGASVINMSLGAPGVCPSVLQDAVNYAFAHGTVVVAAAGNDGTAQANAPANCTNAVGVAVTDQTDARASFSRTGPGVALAAHGRQTIREYFVGGYVSFSGTSMAAPYVSGVMALAWTTTSNPTAQRVVDRVLTTADAIAGTGTLWQHGRLNAAAAVSATTTLTPTPTATPTVTPASTMPALVQSAVVDTFGTTTSASYTPAWPRVIC